MNLNLFKKIPALFRKSASEQPASEQPKITSKYPIKPVQQWYKPKELNEKDILKRARKAKYDPVIKAFLRVMKANVVGDTGFTLQSKVSCFDSETNAKINLKIENDWYKYTKKEFELTGRYNLIDFCSIALVNLLAEGEILVRMYDSGEYGLKFQILPYKCLDYNKNETNIFNGVEVNGNLEPIAYWITNDYELATGKRIPSEEVIHITLNDDPTNYRGVSAFAPVLTLLEDINTYQNAEINAAIAEATQALVYKSGPTAKPFDGFGKPEDEANFKPNSGDGDSNTNPALDALVENYLPKGELGIAALPYDVNIEKVGGSHPNSAGPEFQKMFYKKLAAGLGVSYITLMMDLDASTYSGGRQTALIERPTYKHFRKLLIDKLVERMYEVWLSKYINQNKKEFKKVDGSYKAYFDYEFNNVGFEYINPKDEVEAQSLARKEGFTTMTEILSERGKDLEDILKTIKRERELVESYGLTDVFYKAENKQEMKPIEKPKNTEKEEINNEEDKIKSEDDEIIVINGDKE